MVETQALCGMAGGVGGGVLPPVALLFRGKAVYKDNAIPKSSFIRYLLSTCYIPSAVLSPHLGPLGWLELI